MPDNAGLRIAGYCRISVDDELDRDNVSIENQKAIISDFVGHKFPGAELVFYEDRDRSGYTFEQREGYQAMRRELMAHRLDILVVKDFSRFSRRNSRGLVELEDLRDAGVRIISIGDGIDFPNDDDWLKIQFQFLINEMPVTDTSKKVKSVIRRRQEDGKWICAAPYGYIVNKKQQFEVVPVEADIVRRIYRMYIDGWGYKKIANSLTDEGIPTPRMAERERKIAEGEDYRRSVKSAWSIATVQGILDNDFYIGTFRQGKTTRRKINGADMRVGQERQIVFERHHPEIIDYRTFATVRALRQQRTKSNYRGIKRYDNDYSGFLVCGDCGSPMFSVSRSDLKPAYICGAYHRRGRKACTSHHIHVALLDELLKSYLRRVQENAAGMLEKLNADLAREREDVEATERAGERLEEALQDLQEELRATKRQRIREVMRHPEREELIEETYEEMEGDLARRIEALQEQIERNRDRRNNILRVNRAAKTAMDVFDDILGKEKLDRSDLELIVERIRVYEGRVEIELKPDIDSLIHSGALPGEDASGSVQAAAPAAQDSQTDRRDVPEEYHEIYNKLKGVGCSTFMFPAYIPDGFQVTETKLHSNANDENVKFVMLYEDGTDYLIFQVSHGGDSSFPIYEKDSQSVEIYNQNDIDYYIFTNLASLVSVWSKDHTEYSVSTTLSLPALKEIIDSVFEEVIEQ